MPIYEYVCQNCQAPVDVFQKVNDPPPEKCEACGAKGSMNRVVSRTSFILKGGGWYSDLYSSTKKDGAKAEGDAGPKKESETKTNGEAATSTGKTAAKAESPKSAEATSAPSTGSANSTSTTAK